MNIEKLAKDLADLRYATGYRFQNGNCFHARLTEEDVRGVLKALSDRGYTVSHYGTERVSSPSMYHPGDLQDEPVE